MRAELCTMRARVAHDQGTPQHEERRQPASRERGAETSSSRSLGASGGTVGA